MEVEHRGYTGTIAEDSLKGECYFEKKPHFEKLSKLKQIINYEKFLKRHLRKNFSKVQQILSRF